MQVDMNSILILILCFMVIGALIGIMHSISKTNDRIAELEKKVLKLETILEERKI